MVKRILRGMNQQEKQIVADYDGTFTDSQLESEPYKIIYREQFAQAAGMSVRDVEPLFILAEQEIRADPVSFGWRLNNLIVAPATGDHILLMQSCAREVIKQLDHMQNVHIPKEQSEIDKLLNHLYKESYRQVTPRHREGAQQIIRDLHATGRFTIVTNSHTDTVRGKLKELFQGSGIDAMDIHLVGNAKKWSVDLSWDVVDMITQPKGFPRPVQLRRNDYAGVLQALPNPVGIVAGDIYELDLALPEHLGISTILITSSFTAPWELAHYENHPNGTHVQTLFELRDALDPMI